jgi:hypothetical protein
MGLRIKGWVGATAVALATATAGTANAQEMSRTDRKLFGGDFSFNGLFRVETAFSTSSQVSAANQFGLGSNGRAVNRVAGAPSTGLDNDGFKVPLTPAGLGDLGLSLGLPSLPSFLAGNGLSSPRGVTNDIGVADTITRYVPARDQDVNYHLLRFEITPSINWDSGFSFITRFRAVYDPGGLGYADFNYSDYNDINNYGPGSFAQNKVGDARRQYGGDPDYLGYEVDNKKNPIFFERSGKNYQIDAPAFFLQWTNGNITARVGNQSVAWGQLLFFRIMDVANGLDLRRHLFIDRAIEEFADERMSAPGLRITWQATDNIVVDSFAQQFIPTVLPNENTTYNIVDSRFILHDNYYDQNRDEGINFGVRFKGEFGSFNGQLMYTSRFNQLGAIRWAASNINKRLPNSNYLGLAFNQYCNVLNGTTVTNPDSGCGPQLANTAFEVAPAGLMSAEDWFDRGSYTKLSGIEALNYAIRDFQPATSQLLTSEVDPNQPNAAQVNQANLELDAFFIAAEGLHGHVERNYYREDVYGIGGGIVTEAELGSFFDQILINVEATYTPDRVFTHVGLRKQFDVRDEYQVGLVMEKYHRFSDSIPATYMVFQYLWQKESSLEGLLLDGYGSENFSDQGIKLTKGVPTSTNPKITPGISEGANYVVLAALVPGPQYIFEYSVATLIDVQGGVLMQPGVQWKPVGSVTVNAFYNYIDSDLWGGNKNKSFLSFVDFADEFCLRLGYQF